MRAVVFALAMFCALLSGWTSAVAQAQGLSAGVSLHQEQQGHDAERAHWHPAQAACPGGCPHPGHALHPMLCAACFAVAVTVTDLARLPLRALPVRPVVDLPLTSLSPQPLAPPPRPALST